ncbi:hypothetical protein PTSG_02335 [Salpingoeca rosetta]|uniref:Transcription initiation factor IIA gamma subunit N-terminal domain-containing protein n=1 Tax=Salpingoeca rosetta (strain ATCC 50818 / BSB-021) TaxID=946362 RepID=F2U1W6_SALR5|nr:uncharacterized protein PTSG_02335 [Salpingoeca rosetta]EGD81618.1 hypothetical protein PTSG_02335 [Salpingoeca rosetta]|eukprot:XP_004996822.1 hypothetical protein PTSG_02335 [Salpingoeca rosetta]
MSVNDHYRKTSLGLALQAALDELLEAQSISPDLMNHVLENFDTTMVKRLSNVKHRADLKALCKEYKNMKDFWTISLKDCKFTFSKAEELHTDKLTVFTSKTQ